MRTTPCFVAALLWGLSATTVLPAGAQTTGSQTTGSQTTGTLAERLGYAPDARLLIVHADDIGVTHSVNRASFDAMATGLVNSGSLMVPCPWFPEAADYYRAHPDLDLGLHLTLTSEWKHYRWPGVLPDAAGLHDAQGFLYPDVASVVANATADEVEQELRAQVERALAFGIQPTHLDSHMGTLFQSKAFLEAYLRVGRAYKLPLLLPREAFRQQFPQAFDLLTDDDVLIDHIAMVTPSVAPENWAQHYDWIVKNLKPGVTELILHLGYDDAEMQAVTVDHPDYDAAWRQRDYDYFTSDRFKALLAAQNIQLITWREIGRLIR